MKNKTISVKSDGNFKVNDEIVFIKNGATSKIISISKDIKSKTPETSHQYEITSGISLYGDHFTNKTFWARKKDIRKKLKTDVSFIEPQPVKKIFEYKFKIGQTLYYKFKYEQCTVISQHDAYSGYYEIEFDNNIPGSQHLERQHVCEYDLSIGRNIVTNPRFNPGDIITLLRSWWSINIQKYEMISQFSYDGDNNIYEYVKDELGMCRIFVNLNAKIFREPLVIFSEEDLWSPTATALVSPNDLMVLNPFSGSLV